MHEEDPHADEVGDLGGNLRRVQDSLEHVIPALEALDQEPPT